MIARPQQRASTTKQKCIVDDHSSLRWYAVAAVGVLLGVLSLPTAQTAGRETVAVQVEFVEAISVTENNALQFGRLDADLAADEAIAIAPDGAVTDAEGRVLGGTQLAARLTIAASAAQSISVQVDDVVQGPGYVLGSFVCSYDGALEAACDGAGMSVTSVASASLLIGATLTGDGTAVVGTADGSFNITVSYQ